MKNLTLLKQKSFFKTMLLAVMLLIGSSGVWGQTISYTTVGSTYSQDFNTLPSTGTITFTGLAVRDLSASPVSASGMTGWYFVKNTGSGGTDLFVVDNGSGTSGGLKDYGTTSSTDRALGGLGSGTYVPKFGALIKNNTGGTLNKFTITFTGEQWRVGSINTNTLTFKYAIGATTINDANTSVTSLNFVNKVSSSTGAALDGNVVANRTTGITATISGLNWENGTVLAIRWDKADETGADDGLAIDDLTFSADVQSPTNYYYNGTGNLNDVTSWGTNPNGTGTNPPNFTSDIQIFNIQNTSAVTTTSAWTVSGSGSKIVVGNGTDALNLTIASGYAITGTIDVSSNVTLVMQDATLPTFGSISATSTVVYDGASSQNIVQTSYGNLTLSSAGTKTFTGNTTTVRGNLIINNTTLDAPSASPFATLNLGGNLTYQGTVTSPSDGSSITLIMNGSGTQTITGNGNTARWFKLQTTNSGNNIILSETGGTSNLLVGNISGGGINLVAGTTLSINANTLTFFNGNGTIVGNGTISCSSSSNIEVNKTGTTTFGTLLLTSGHETLNTLTLNMSGTGSSIALGSSATVSTLNISAGTLNVSAGKQLTVNSALTNNGTLTLKSDATNGTATVITNGTVSGGGTTNVEQTLSADRNWWYLASPLSGASSSVFSGDQIGKYVEDYLNDNDGNTNAPYYTSPFSTPETLAVGRGYVIKRASTDAATYTFSGGSLNNGDVTLTPTRTGNAAAKRGFNLVGNPYPSYLNWELAYNANKNNNIRPTIWYRTQVSDGSGGYKMDFQTYNAALDVSVPTTTSGYIPPMQAFWLEVDKDPVSAETVSNGTLNLTNNMRAHASATGNSTDNRLKVPMINERQLVRLQVSNGAATDETVIAANPNASAAYDLYDSEKMSVAGKTEIFTLAGTEELVINGVNSLSEGNVFALGFRPGQTGSFSIEATQLENIDAKVMLLDKVAVTEQELTAGIPYTFSVEDAAATNDRFVIKLVSKVPTGIEVGNASRDLTVFTNRNNRIQVIYSGEISAQTAVSVYNIAGQKLNTQKITKAATELNENFRPGVYMVQLTDNEKKITQKLVIN